MNRDHGRPRRAALCVLASVALAPLSFAGLGTMFLDEARAQTRIAALALNGFDPVSYFLPEGPRPGAARFETEWGGRVWRFAFEANRSAFRLDPSAYAPRLGGFDAAGILDQRLVDADPLQFAVLDGRLYLFRDAERRARFIAEPGLARKAEAIWPTLGRLVDDPEETARPTSGPL